MPLISIITTTYRHQNFIRYTIESVLSQEFSDWEMLIGDDSPDNETQEIIQEYVKKYPDKIQVWHHSPNKGIIDNMNFLMSKASSESQYIAFLEGDDIYTKDHLQKKIGIFKEYKDVALVYNNIDLIDLENKVILRDFFSKKGIRYYKNSLISAKDYLFHKTGPICSFSTAMIRKDILEKIKLINPINDDKRYANPDFDFYFKICQQYRIYGIEESLTLYRRHSGNLSGEHLKLFTDLEELIQYYGDKKILPWDIVNHKLSRLNTLKSISCMYKRDKRDGLKYFLESLRLSPWSNVIYKISNFGLLLIPNSLLGKILEKVKIK